MKDPFRELYPALKRYTWRKSNALKLARLDMFLLSNNLMSYVQNVIIENSYRSDHSGVVIYVKLDTIETGKGLWKFNNSLLSDRDYLNIIKQTISKVTTQYAVLIYTLENIMTIPKN